MEASRVVNGGPQIDIASTHSVAMRVLRNWSRNLPANQTEHLRTLAESHRFRTTLQTACEMPIGRHFPLSLLFRFRPSGVSGGEEFFLELFGREHAGFLIENNSISAGAGDFAETLLIVSI